MAVTMLTREADFTVTSFWGAHIAGGEVPDEVRKSMMLWVGCIAGTLEEHDFAAKLGQAGFVEVSIEPTRVYEVEDARKFLEDAGVDVDAIAEQAAGSLMAAFVRATKPALPCCGPACCN